MWRNTKKLSRCNNIERHRFKFRLHVPRTNGKKMGKILNVESYSDAVIEAIDFEQEFRSEIQIGRNLSQGSKRYYLFDAQIQYIDFLDNVNVPEHQKIGRSDKHIKEVQTCLLLFNEALTKNKVNKKMLLIDQITDNHVGFFTLTY